MDRIDAITLIPPERAVVSPPIPRSVKIELTGKCNFMCSFCARSQALRDQQPMDRSLFERLLLDMRAAGVEEIGLFYLGESFMVPWLADAVRFAKKDAGFPYVFLTTNGSLSTPEKVRACIEAGLDSLKFSYNYADLDQFLKVAEVKEKLYWRMKANVIASRRVRDEVEARTGHHCELSASYIEYDGEQGDRMRYAVSEIEPFMDQVYALPLYNQANLVSDMQEKLGWQPTAGNRGRVGALRDPLPCWAAFTEGHITWDGKLSACCFDHNGNFEMGDLTVESFSDAWTSTRFATLRAAHLKRDVSGTVCEGCVAWQ